MTKNEFMHVVKIASAIFQKAVPDFSDKNTLRHWYGQIGDREQSEVLGLLRYLYHREDGLFPTVPIVLSYLDRPDLKPDRKGIATIRVRDALKIVAKYSHLKEAGPIYEREFSPEMYDALQFNKLGVDEIRTARGEKLARIRDHAIAKIDGVLANKGLGQDGMPKDQFGQWN